VAPTEAPTEAPTVAPTEVPTANPTEFPTSQPTGQPTGQPTSQPTIDESALWRIKSSELLASITLTDNVQAVYSQLTVKGGFDDAFSPDKWSVFVGTTVPVFDVTLVAEKIQIYSVSNLDTTDFSTVVEECDDVDAVASLLDVSSLNRDVSCNSKTWRVGGCSSISDSPSYCVNCGSDACDATCSVDSFGLYPTGSSCDYASTVDNVYNVNFIRAMVVTFRPPNPAPNVTSISVSNTLQTSVDVTVNLESNGVVYVLARDVAGSEVLSLTDLIQNGVVGLTVGNTVTVNVDGLIASKDYQIVAAVVSAEGVQVTDAVFGSQYVTSLPGSEFTTICCRDVNVDVNFKQLQVNTQFTDGITVTVDAVPTGVEELTLEFSTTTSGSETTGSADYFFPSSCIFSASSLSTSCSISIVGVPDVSEQVVVASASFLNSTGVSVAAPYNVTFDTGSTVSFTSDAVAPDAPVLLSAVFASDGSFVLATFNTPTNKGDITSSLFDCNVLLTSTDSSVTLKKCNWLSKTVLKIRAANIDVGYDIEFKTDLIRGQCFDPFAAAGTCGDFAAYNHSVNDAVAVAPPASVTVPNVVFTSPTLIGSCTDLALLLTSSSGNGGRAWASRTFAVTAVNTSQATLIENFLNTNYVFSPVTVIPGIDDLANDIISLIPPGSQYTFKVTLCNFLGACGSGSSSVIVLANILPSVAILGDPVRDGTRSDVLEINGEASTPDCSGVATTKDLVYIYQVYKGAAGASPKASDEITFTSLSADPSVLLLPKYFLDANQAYIVVLSVLNSATQASASTQVSVNVGAEGVTALISGGNTQTLERSNTPTATVLSASNSIDRDYDPALGTNTNLVYLWSCIQTSPTFSTTCPFNLPADLTGISIDVTADIANADKIAEISVLVKSDTDTVGASDSVIVDVGAAGAPVLEIDNAEDFQDAILGKNQLKVSTFVTHVEDVSYEWVCNSADVDLSQAITGSSGTLSIGSLSSKVSEISLVLPGNSIPDLSTVEFTVTATLVLDGNVTAQTGLSVTTAGPPEPGALSVSPLTGGEELTTFFEFAVDLWTTDFPPLTYQFGFVSSTGDFNSLRARSEGTTVSVQLPAGDENSGNNLTVRAVVFDANSASTSFDVVVQVNPVDISPSDLNTQTADNLANAGDTNSKTQLVATTSEYMNGVDCSSAPTCADLKRGQCSEGSVANTCGSCLPTYSGVSGQANSACVSTVARRMLSDSPQRVCNNDCSSNGTCSFVNIDNGEAVDSCTEADVNCLPICTCSDGFYGTICGYTEADMTSTSATRTVLLETLLDTVEAQSVNDVNVLSWISSINSNTLQPDQLDLNGTQTALLIVKEIVDGLPVTTLTTAEAANVLVALDNLAFWLTGYVNHLPITFTQESLSQMFATRASVFDGYVDFISSRMESGQADISNILSQVRVLNSVHLIASGVPDESTDVAIVTDTTQAEQDVSYELHSVGLSVTNDYSNTDVLRTGEFVTRSNIFFNTDLKSDPLRLGVLAYPCAYDGSSSCDIGLTLTHSRAVPVSLANLSETGAVYATACDTGSTDTTDLICDDTHNVTATCSGIAGVIHTRCPHYREIAKCAALVGNVPGSLCTTTSYTESVTECVCSLQNAASSSTDPVTREYAVVMSEIEEGFLQNFIATTGVPSSQPSSQPTSFPSSAPSFQPTSVPTKSPVDESILFTLTDSIKECYSTCDLFGFNYTNLTVAPSAQFCAFFDAQTCTGSSIGDNTCRPSCLASPSCDGAFCSTFAYMQEMCANVIGDANIIADTNTECLLTATGNSHLVEFGLQFVIPNTDFNLIADDSTVQDVIGLSLVAVISGASSVTSVTAVDDSSAGLIRHRHLATGDALVTAVIEAVPTVPTQEDAATDQADALVTDFKATVDSGVFGLVLINNQKDLASPVISTSSINNIVSTSVETSTDVTAVVIATPTPTVSPTSAPSGQPTVSFTLAFAAEGSGDTTGTTVILIMLAVLLFLFAVWSVYSHNVEKQKRANLAKFQSSQKPYASTTENPAEEDFGMNEYGDDEVVLGEVGEVDASNKQVSLVPVEDASVLLG